MNRPIKFRCWVPAGYARWRSEKGQMLSWEQVLDDLHSEINPKKSVLGEWYGAEKDVQPVLMQFTGLKDKNGKEIFEDDLIQMKKGVVYRVFWGSKDGWAVCSPNKWAPEKSKYVYKRLRWATDGEIIGNIYENPELIRSLKNHD